MLLSTQATSRQKGVGGAFLLCCGALLASAAPAVAADVNFQLGLASEYVGKGLGKSGGDPALSGSVGVSAGAVYGSVFVSSAETAQGADAEIVSTVGWRPRRAGFAFDLAVTNRDLPGTRSGLDANYWEFQADASRKLGPVTARLRVNYTPDGYAATEQAWWVEAQGSVAVGPRTQASVAIGDRTADGGAEYAAWNAGVKHRLTDALAADLRWYDTDSHALGDNYDGRLVGALSYAF